MTVNFQKLCPDAIKMMVQGKVHFIEEYEGCVREMYLFFPLKIPRGIILIRIHVLKDKSLSNTHPELP